MNKIIIQESSSDIRAISRNALQNNWVQVAIGIMIYYVLMVVIPALLTLLIPGSTLSLYNNAIDRTQDISYVSSLYSTVLTGAFTLGLSSFMLLFFRKRDINPGYLFNGFEHFFKALGLTIMIGIFVFLWTLLLIIPGIIAAIRYSQAYFIMAESPEKGIMQCIDESKRLMDGNKGKYFILCLSFIGWAILVSIPTAIVSEIFEYGFLALIFDFIASIPYFFMVAYLNTAQVAFYDLATGNLIAKPKFIDEEV